MREPLDSLTVRGAGHTVLVVDDDASLRMLCRANLELEGYRVLEAATAGAADELLDSESVDVMLLDIHLGRDDGLELLADIRARRPGVAVALFSGTAEVGRAGRESADGVIRKPFSLEELSATVGRLAAL